MITCIDYCSWSEQVWQSIILIDRFRLRTTVYTFTRFHSFFVESVLQMTADMWYSRFHFFFKMVIVFILLIKMAAGNCFFKALFDIETKTKTTTKEQNTKFISSFLEALKPKKWNTLFLFNYSSRTNEVSIKNTFVKQKSTRTLKKFLGFIILKIPTRCLQPFFVGELTTIL